MSKLIVEMEMPTRCAECDIVQKTKSGYRCPIASKIHGFSCVAGRGQLERPHYCPVDGELPEEHGDLVDADTVLWGEEVPDSEGIVVPVTIGDVIEGYDVPIVIAAERKDDENN